MAVKTNGKEFKTFYADPTYWPAATGKPGTEVWHEEELVTLDGKEVDDPDFDLSKVEDTARLVIEGGQVFGPQWDHGDGPSLETYFRRWKKAQTTTAIVIECDISKLDAVKAAVKAAGGRVV